MVIYLSHWGHQYTVKSPAKKGALKRLSYDELFQRKSVPLATYIFSDIDRMAPWEREMAAVAYRILKQAGARVLNDPAQVRTRHELLRTLHQDGLNSFNSYRLSMGEWPEQYPVFLRRDHLHTGVLGNLLHDKQQLEASMRELLDQGIPHSNLIAVEYCAQALQEGLFRKYAVYRIGDDYVRDLSVHDSHWAPKYGEEGAASEEMYAEELGDMDSIPHEDTVKCAFNLARIEYGRIDFGVVDGHAQIYEINTNPAVGRLTIKHPNSNRVKSKEYFTRNYLEALGKLDDSSNKGSIALDQPQLNNMRKACKGMLRRNRSMPSI